MRYATLPSLSRQTRIEPITRCQPAPSAVMDDSLMDDSVFDVAPSSDDGYSPAKSVGFTPGISGPSSTGRISACPCVFDEVLLTNDTESEVSSEGCNEDQDGA